MISTTLALLVATPASWTLGLGGDIMLNGVSPDKNPFVNITRQVQACNVFIGNLEIPLTDKTVATTRKSPAAVRARTQYILKADPGHAAHLESAGFDLVSLGNNHSMDYGPAGLSQMLGLLKKSKIAFAGAGNNQRQAWTSATIQKGGSQRIGFSSFLSFMSDSANDTCWPASDKSAGLAALKLQGTVDAKDMTTIRNIVANARRKGSFVVIALHWGIEKKTVPTPYQVALGRAFIDAGADVVAGHHPHVLQGAEIYKGKPIFYSLGNLVSPRPGITAVFQLTYTGNRLEKIAIAPCAISGGSVSAKSMPSEKKRFDGLCQAVQRSYGVKASGTPTIVEWR